MMCYDQSQSVTVFVSKPVLIGQLCSDTFDETHRGVLFTVQYDTCWHNCTMVVNFCGQPDYCDWPYYPADGARSANKHLWKIPEFIL